MAKKKKRNVVGLSALAAHLSFKTSLWVRFAFYITDSLLITIKFLGSNLLITTFKPSDTIESVKNMIKEQKGYEPGKQRLLYGETELKTGDLTSNNVNGDATFFLVLNP